MMYDLAIIGGGPAGYVAAENAGARGMKVVLFEKRELGGVCLNEGCIPTKTLLYSAKMYDHAQGGKKYGITAEGVAYDYKKIADRKTKVVRKLVAGIKMKMEHNNVEVVRGDAYINSGDEHSIGITCGEASYEAARLLICTGSEAFVPPIPGVQENDAILTNREILALTAAPESLVIIGGGVIGMEFASFYNSLGIAVTVIEMLPEILGGLDKEVSEMLRGIYTKKGVKFNLSCKVTAVEGHCVHYTDSEGNAHFVEGDKILMSVGRRPVLTGFGLENIPVAVERGIKVNEKMQTTMPNVYAAGDVTGFSLLAHTASREGEVAINNMLGGEDKMEYNAIPGIVYTNPEVSCVGLTEEQAQAQGIEYRLSKLPMTYAGRFVAENEGQTGLCKILTDGEGRVLGVHLLGNTSSEFICAACMAITNRLTIDDLRRTVFPHPTACEILKEGLFELV
ncbi:MAG: dihydrolipoyl dehydrogenase [Bacteroidaceae bacterium]|nr:dihydrolipoyl dehydrogenase [Bacteroidaceae bacterium]